jgi:ADP-ribose pyrophosphatase
MTRKVKYRGRFLTFVELTYADAHGQKHTWEIVDRARSDQVVIVFALTPQDEVLLTKQFRPARGKPVIEFPAGISDRGGESLRALARRELEEETGWRARSVRKALQGPISSGLSSEFGTLFIATGLRFAGKKRGREEDAIEVLRVPRAKFVAWLRRMQRRNDVEIDFKIMGALELINL